MSMRKGIKRLIAVLLIVSFVAAGSVIAYAAPVDPSRPSSLTLQYQHNGTYYEGLSISVYRIGDVNSDGNFSLTGKFKNYSVKINGVTSQSEWKTIAATLSAYIASDGLSPDLTAVTDEKGIVSWKNIPPGLYLTLSVRAEGEGVVTIFEDFLTAIPYPSGNGTYNYDVTAYPKCTTEEIVPGMETYRVIKQWKDDGNKENRPESVRVRILRNGTVESIQTLSSKNNWSFSWTAEKDGSLWQAAEVAIPAGYTVTFSSYDNTFILTNTWQNPEDPDSPDVPDVPNPPDTPDVPDVPNLPDSPDVPHVPNPPDTPVNPDEPADPDESDWPDLPGIADTPNNPKQPSTPKTGDTTVIWPYVLAMAASGSFLILLSIWRIRKED